jgi:hypothetical protein
MLFIPLQVFAYEVQVESYGGTQLMSNTGIDIQIYVPQTQYADERSYYGLPPTSLSMYFYDYQLPPGYEFLVCAYYSDDDTQITCESYYRGSEDVGITTVDLSPWS